MILLSLSSIVVAAQNNFLNIGIFKTPLEIRESLEPFNDMSFEGMLSETDTLNGIVFTSDYVDWFSDRCVEQVFLFETTSSEDIIELFERAGFYWEGRNLCKRVPNGTILADINARKNENSEIEYISARVMAMD